MKENANDKRLSREIKTIFSILLAVTIVAFGVLLFDQATKDKGVAKVNLEEIPDKQGPLRNLKNLGVSFVDQIEKDQSTVKAVLEGLPSEQGSLKNLAAQLAEQERITLAEMNIEQGDDLWLIDAKSSHPERFIVSPEWFVLVAQNKDIPDYQKKVLVDKAEEGPVSTTNAARWIQDTSHAMKSKAAYEAQKTGVQVLKDSIR